MTIKNIIKLSDEELNSIRLSQAIIEQACKEVHKTCLDCPFYQHDDESELVCINRLLNYAIEELKENLSK